jgi:hypothetical protein
VCLNEPLEVRNMPIAAEMAINAVRQEFLKVYNAGGPSSRQTKPAEDRLPPFV